MANKSSKNKAAAPIKGTAPIRGWAVCKELTISDIFGSYIPSAQRFVTKEEAITYQTRMISVFQLREGNDVKYVPEMNLTGTPITMLEHGWAHLVPVVGRARTASAGIPITGFFIAVTSAGLFVLAALAVTGIWLPFNLWRWCSSAGAVLSLFLMVMFFGATKIIPIAVDVFVLWAAWTNVIARA